MPEIDLFFFPPPASTDRPNRRGCALASRVSALASVMADRGTIAGNITKTLFKFESDFLRHKKRSGVVLP